ncbi:30S ribosomal protein S12 domain protein [Cooperia oncophora]
MAFFCTWSQLAFHCCSLFCRKISALLAIRRISLENGILVTVGRNFCPHRVVLITSTDFMDLKLVTSITVQVW